MFSTSRFSPVPFFYASARQSKKTGIGRRTGIRQRCNDPPPLPSHMRTYVVAKGLIDACTKEEEEEETPQKISQDARAPALLERFSTIKAGDFRGIGMIRIRVSPLETHHPILPPPSLPVPHPLKIWLSPR